MPNILLEPKPSIENNVELYTWNPAMKVQCHEDNTEQGNAVSTIRSASDKTPLSIETNFATKTSIENNVL